MRYKKAIDKRMLNWDTQKEKCIVQFILLDKNMLVQSKILSALGQKHQVACDHYSLEDLKTIASSMVVQLFRTCPHGNGGSLMLLASGSALTMPMVKLSNAPFTSNSCIMPFFLS